MEIKFESIDQKKYKIDTTKINSVDSIRLFIELLDIHFVPRNDEIYQKYKSILIEKGEKNEKHNR